MHKYLVSEEKRPEKYAWDNNSDQDGTSSLEQNKDALHPATLPPFSYASLSETRTKQD